MGWHEAVRGEAGAPEGAEGVYTARRVAPRVTPARRPVRSVWFEGVFPG